MAERAVEIKLGCFPPLVTVATAGLIAAKIMGASFSWWWCLLPFGIAIAFPIALFLLVSLFAFITLLSVAGADARDRRKMIRQRNKWRRNAMEVRALNKNRGKQL